MKPLVLPLPPSANNRLALVRGRFVQTREARAYKQAVALKALAHGMRPLHGEIAVQVHVYRARRSGDLDNFFKAAFDALKGIAWDDDKQVVRLVADRYEDKANPRMEVWVEAVGLKRER